VATSEDLKTFAAGLLEVTRDLARVVAHDSETRFLATNVLEPQEGKALIDVVTEAGKGKVIVSGKVADFDWDREDEIFEPGAFDAGLEAFKQNPIMVYSHAKKLMDTVNGPSGYVQIGKWDPESFEKRADGLYATGEVYEPESGILKDVYNQIARGDMRGASVGGRFHKRRGPDGRARIHQVDMHEISLAPKPVNLRTLLDVAVAA
jgi:HK97 family phage prohead protease